MPFGCDYYFKFQLTRERANQEIGDPETKRARNVIYMESIAERFVHAAHVRILIFTAVATKRPTCRRYRVPRALSR